MNEYYLSEFPKIIFLWHQKNGIFECIHITVSIIGCLSNENT